MCKSVGVKLAAMGVKTIIFSFRHNMLPIYHDTKSNIHTSHIETQISNMIKNLVIDLHQPVKSFDPPNIKIKNKCAKK